MLVYNDIYIVFYKILYFYDMIQNIMSYIFLVLYFQFVY